MYKLQDLRRQVLPFRHVYRPSNSRRGSSKLPDSATVKTQEHVEPVPKHASEEVNKTIEALANLLTAAEGSFEDNITRVRQRLDEMAKRQKAEEADFKGIISNTLKIEVELKKMRFQTTNLAKENAKLHQREVEINDTLTALTMEQQQKPLSPAEAFKDVMTQTTDGTLAQAQQPQRLSPSGSFVRSPGPLGTNSKIEDLTCPSTDELESNIGGENLDDDDTLQISPELPITLAQKKEIDFPMWDLREKEAQAAQAPKAGKARKADIKGAKAVQPSNSTTAEAANQPVVSRDKSDLFIEYTLSNHESFAAEDGESNQETSPLRRGKKRRLKGKGRKDKVISFQRKKSQNLNRKKFKRKRSIKLSIFEIDLKLDPAHNIGSVDSQMVYATLHLRAVLIRHVSNSVHHVQHLLQRVTNERNNARAELNEIEEIEAQIVKVQEQLKEQLSQSPDQENLGVVQANDDVEVLKLRKPGNHKCQFCLCHNTKEQVKALATLDTPKQLQDMMDHCSHFVAILGTVEGPFAQACDEIIIIDEEVDTLRADVLIGEMDSMVYQPAFSLETGDSEIMKIVHETLDIPNGTRDLALHAIFVSQTVNLLVTEMMAMVIGSKDRMSKFNAKKFHHHHLLKLLPKLKALKDTAGLDHNIACLRRREIDTLLMIRGGICPYCNCNNMPLEVTSSTPMPAVLIGPDNTLIKNVAIAHESMKHVLKSTTLHSRVLHSRFRKREVRKLSGPFEEALADLTKAVAFMKEQLLDYELGENYKGMYIMDASGWRRVQIPSQEEVPMTTVSVPGQGLPMLTGLKHELADPSFYDRHREDVVDSSKPHKAWLKIRRDSDTKSAYIPGKSRRKSVKASEKKEEERGTKSKGKPHQKSNETYAATAGKRKGRASLKNEKDDEAGKRRESFARHSVGSSMTLEEKASTTLEEKASTTLEEKTSKITNLDKHASNVSLRVKRKSESDEPAGKVAKVKKSDHAKLKPDGRKISGSSQPSKGRSARGSKAKKTASQTPSLEESEDSQYRQIYTEIVDENGRIIKGRVLGTEFRRLKATVVDEESQRLYGRVINDEGRKLYAEVVDDDTGQTLYGKVVEEEGKEVYAEVVDENGEAFYGKVVDEEQLQVLEKEYRLLRASVKRVKRVGKRVTRTSVDAPMTEAEAEALGLQAKKVLIGPEPVHKEEDISSRSPSLSEYENDLFAIGSDPRNISWGQGSLRRESKAAQESLKGEARPVQESLRKEPRPVQESLTGEERSVQESLTGEARSVQESLRGEARSVQESLRGEARSVQESLRGEARSVQESLRGEARSVQESLRGEARSVQESLRGEARSVQESLRGEARSVQESLTGEARSVQEPLTGEARSVQESLTGEARSVQESLRGEARSVQESLTGEEALQTEPEALQTEPGATKPPELKTQKEIEAMQESMEKSLVKSSTMSGRPQSTSEKVGVAAKTSKSIKNIRSRKAEPGSYPEKTLEAMETSFRKHEGVTDSVDLDSMKKTDLIQLAEEETQRQRGLLAEEEKKRQRRLLKLEKQRQEQLFKEKLELKHKNRLKEEESQRQRRIFKAEEMRVQQRLLQEQEERKHQKKMKEEEEQRHQQMLKAEEEHRQQRLLKEEEKQKQRILMEEKEKQYIETLKQKEQSDLTEEDKRRIADSEWRKEYLKGIRRYSSRVIKETDEIREMWNARHEAHKIAQREKEEEKREKAENEKVLQKLKPAWFRHKARRGPPKKQIIKSVDPLTEMTKEFLQVKTMASRKETVQEEERPRLTRMISRDPVEMFPLAPDTGITIKGFKSDMQTADKEHWERERKKSRRIAEQELEGALYSGYAHTSLVTPEDLLDRTREGKRSMTTSPEQMSRGFKKKSTQLTAKSVTLVEQSTAASADTEERLSAGCREREKQQPPVETEAVETEAMRVTITPKIKSEQARRYDAARTKPRSASPKPRADLFRLDGKTLQDVEPDSCRPSTKPGADLFKSDGKALQDVEHDSCRPTVPARSRSLLWSRSLPSSLEPLLLAKSDQHDALVAGDWEDEDLLSARRKKEGSAGRARKARRWRPRRMHNAMLLVREQINMWRAGQIAVNQIGPKKEVRGTGVYRNGETSYDGRNSLFIGIIQRAQTKYADTEEVVAARTMGSRKKRSHREAAGGYGAASTKPGADLLKLDPDSCRPTAPARYRDGKTSHGGRNSLLIGAMQIAQTKYADTEEVVAARTMGPREERSHRVPFILPCPAPSHRLFESPSPTFDVNPKLLAMREEAHNEYFLQYSRIRRGRSDIRTSAPQDTLYHMMYAHANRPPYPSLPRPRLMRQTSLQRTAGGPKPPLSPYPPQTADTPMQRLFGHLYKQAQRRSSWSSYRPLPTPPYQHDDRPSPRVGGKEQLQVPGVPRQDQRDYDSLRITPSRGIVSTFGKTRKQTLQQILDQPQDFIAGEARESPRQRQGGFVVEVEVMDAKRVEFSGEESHFAGTADKRLVFGIQGKRVLPVAGGSKQGVKQRCQHVTACGWYDPRQLAYRRADPDMLAAMPPVAAGHSGKGSKETAAPAHYIASPDCADRFFFENKRSMITLDVKAPPPPDPYFSSRLLRQRLPPRLAGQFPLGVYPTVAEMEAYSRMKQNHRPSRREPRVSGTPKPVTVVRKPDMLKHIRLGWQTMQQRKRGEMPAMAAYHDLFENILLYDVPGTSKMQNDYSGLMERTDSIDTLCSNMTLPDTMNLNQSNPR
ncbi:uncharacterized protein [Littorina saxatilis]|uniref:uncharacterized protein n=1 Tax=Littorina saxatilis TaxID=31220 RepID=UPI0038B508D7